jgi:hypothetical protein
MKREKNTHRTAMIMLVPMLALLLATGLSGCAALSPYSATSFQQLTQLKAFHIMFIDEFTSETPQPLDQAKLAAEAGAGELKFREAEEYSTGLKDTSRTYSVQVLHRMFENNLAWLQKGNTYGRANAGEQKTVLQSAYDQAIRGETVRTGAPK